MERLNPLSTGKYPKTDTIEGSRLTQAKLSSCTRAKQCFAVPRSSLISREVCSDVRVPTWCWECSCLNPLSAGKSVQTSAYRMMMYFQTVLIPYLQGSIQNRYYRGFTSNSSKAFVLHSGKAVLCWSSFIPYLQGSLFRRRRYREDDSWSVLIPYLQGSIQKQILSRVHV